MHTRFQLFLAAALSASGAAAQSDLQLPFLYGAPATIANPAHLQDHSVTVGLPSVSVGSSSPFAVDEVGEVRDGTLYLDGERVIAALEAAERDPLVTGRVETLSFNYRSAAGWQVGLGHATRFQGQLGLPVGLAQLATYGNGPYVGEVLGAAPDLSVQAYQEFSFHGAYSVSEALTIGLRAKYLSGSGALLAEDNRLDVYTDPDLYQATITTDATMYSAGVPVDFDGLGVDVGSLSGPMGAGSGFGIDLGLVFRPSEELELGLSARDIGSINWSGETARQHVSRGTYTFEGYRGELFGENGARDFSPAAVVDSLVGAVAFESSEASFRTTLPTTVQATGRYAAATHTRVDATVYAAQVDAWYTGFGVGVTQGFGKFGQVGVLGGARTGGAFVGANVAVDLWGPQLYVACDNLLTVFDAAGGRDAHVRAGLNLAFGAIKKQKAVKGFYDTKVEGINK